MTLPLIAEHRTATMCGVFAEHLQNQGSVAEAERYRAIWRAYGAAVDSAEWDASATLIEQMLRRGAELRGTVWEPGPREVSKVVSTRSGVLAEVAMRMREADTAIRWLRCGSRRFLHCRVGIRRSWWRIMYPADGEHRQRLDRLLVYTRMLWLRGFDALIRLQMLPALALDEDAHQARRQAAALIVKLNHLARTIHWTTVRIYYTDSPVARARRRRPEW